MSNFRAVDFVLFIGIGVIFWGTACSKRSENAENLPKPTTRPAFDPAGSDAKAIALADEEMAACGGIENWDKTRFVVWNWFGKRINVWDKWTGDIRVESRRSLILMNLNTMKGRAWKNGNEITEPEALQRAMAYGYEAWASDSYWMFLPFKLKDNGVILKYVGEDTTQEGQRAEVISLTFKNVGLTPQNKFHIYLDKTSKLLVQWDFYVDANDPVPRFSTPWKNYQKYGEILLSDDRGPGPGKKHKDVAVFAELPATVFHSPEPVSFASLSRLIEQAEEENE